jgi:hypothetical protein
MKFKIRIEPDTRTGWTRVLVNDNVLFTFHKVQDANDCADRLEAILQISGQKQGVAVTIE